jgi:predicted nucleic acid-binding protein
MTPALIWDCSVTVAMAFEDERDGYSRRVFQAVRQGGALAPAHWPMEVVNALRSAERRNRIVPSASLEFLAKLTRLPVRIEGFPGVATNMTALYGAASECALTAYDAAYLRLAQQTGLPLAAKDDELNKAARRKGVALFA